MNHVSFPPIHQLLWNVVYLLRYGNDNIPILQVFLLSRRKKNRIRLLQAMGKCEVCDTVVASKGRGSRVAS